MQQDDQPVPVEQLQFRQAEVAGATASRRCVACKSPIFGEWFQAAGRTVCPNCAARIQSGQQAAPAHSLLKAALFGGAAALAGCAIYATVAIVAHLELALIAILIGYMVGRAIRYASNGRGGRPQQILAVVLTYFAITFSYLAVFLYNTTLKAPTDMAGLIAGLLGVAAAAPFLALNANMAGGLLSLVIIFFGLRQAWRMTGRSDILVMGPYTPGP